MTADLASARCLVLGGGGFIGNNLCRALAATGADVRAFGRSNRVRSDDRVRWIAGEFSDHTAVDHAVSGCDLVFHVVSTNTPATANDDLIGDVTGNLIATLQLLEICRRAGNPRVVFVSTGGAIYGQADLIPTPETAPVQPIGAYGITKLAIERYLALYELLHGLPYRVLRVANPFGPYQVGRNSQGIVAIALMSALNGTPMTVWGDGTIVRDYIYIDDVADALLRVAVHSGPSRVFNIGSGEGRSINEIIAAVERQTLRPVKVHRNPARPTDVGRSVLDIDRARSELGWAPRVPFEEGLARTAEWLASASVSGR